MLRAVIFDLDDTLIDWSQREGEWADHSRRHLMPVYNYLLHERYPVPDLEMFAAAYRDENRKAWEKAGPPDWKCPHQLAIMRSTLRALYLDVRAIDVEKCLELFAWDVIPGVRPYADALDVLTILRSEGLSTGLLTNAALPTWMREVELASLGLIDLLDQSLTAGDVGHLKPHPRPFEEILKRLQVEPDEAIFVGDRLQDDVIGAQGVGMRAVWVRRGIGQDHFAVKPNAAIDSLLELLDTLDLWFPAWRAA